MWKITMGKSILHGLCLLGVLVNFGLLMAEIGSGVWGTPTNFNEFCVLAALLHGI